MISFLIFLLAYIFVGSCFVSLMHAWQPEAFSHIKEERELFLVKLCFICCWPVLIAFFILVFFLGLLWGFLKMFEPKKGNKND